MAHASISRFGSYNDIRKLPTGSVSAGVDNCSFDDIIDANMSTSNNTISISELRQDATNLINLAVSQQNPLIVMQRSKPKVVVVDYQYFRALEEAIMDITDNQEAEKAKLEPTESFDKYFEKRFGGKTE